VHNITAIPAAKPSKPLVTSGGMKKEKLAGNSRKEAVGLVQEIEAALEKAQEAMGRSRRVAIRVGSYNPVSPSPLFINAPAVRPIAAMLTW
jgi:hypothetical protein